MVSLYAYKLELAIIKSERNKWKTIMGAYTLYIYNYYVLHSCKYISCDYTTL